VGVGVPQLHSVRTTQKGETHYCVHIRPLILPGGSVSLSRDDWYQLRRDKCCGTTTASDVYRNTPSPAPHPASVPPISLPLHCTTFPSTAGAPRPPTFSAPTRSTRICRRGRCRLPSQLPGPRYPRRVWCFDPDGEVWGGSACVQALPRHSGRRRKNNGMGRRAMEAPARCSRAEPHRMKLALGGRFGVGDLGASRVGWRMRGVGRSRALALVAYHSRISSHRIFFFHLSSIHACFFPTALTLLLLTCTPFTLLKTYCLFDYVHLRLRFFFLVDFHSRLCTSRLALVLRACFFNVPFFRSAINNANDVDSNIEPILCLVQGVSSVKEKRRISSGTWMHERRVDGREEQDPEDKSFLQGRKTKIFHVRLIYGLGQPTFCARVGLTAKGT
jgi:hypothetical protein